MSSEPSEDVDDTRHPRSEPPRLLKRSRGRGQGSSSLLAIAKPSTKGQGGKEDRGHGKNNGEHKINAEQDSEGSETEFPAPKKRVNRSRAFPKPALHKLQDIFK